MNLFTLNKGSIYAVPILHYTMELAMSVKLAFDAIKPDCVAVELPENLQDQFVHAAARLPDISVIQTEGNYYLCEPCEPTLEGLRSALDLHKGAYCIDLDVENYPLHKEILPDPYSIIHIGLKEYYGAYLHSIRGMVKDPLDLQRELHMAKRLKELSLRYEKILFVGGFYHVASVLELTSQNHFEIYAHAKRNTISLATLTEDACRDVMGECGWISSAYELWRPASTEGLLDRQKLLYTLYKTAAERYRENTGNAFLGYHLRNIMKFVRNYSLIHRRLMPDLFETLCAAKGCVDHNYAYETWYLATSFPFRKNIDNLEELNLTVEQVWGHSKLIRFHLKQKNRKGLDFHRRKKDQSKVRLRPPSPYSICSYPPEDSVVERFGDFLKKKGNTVLSEEGARSLPLHDQPGRWDRHP